MIQRNMVLALLLNPAITGALGPMHENTGLAKHIKRLCFSVGKAENCKRGCCTLGQNIAELSNDVWNIQEQELQFNSH